MGQSNLGAKLLSTDDPEEAKNIAWTLNDCNDKRKDIQRTMEREAIENSAEYIARNPERKGLIDVDAFATYPFTGCLLPGAARLKLFTENGWDEIWRTLAFLKRTECFRRPDPKYDSQ